MARRLSTNEMNVLTQIRNANPTIGQRTLANDLIVRRQTFGFLTASGFSDLTNRPVATVYNAIRRIDGSLNTSRPVRSSYLGV